MSKLKAEMSKCTNPLEERVEMLEVEIATLRMALVTTNTTVVQLADKVKDNDISVWTGSKWLEL